MSWIHDWSSFALNIDDSHRLIESIAIAITRGIQESGVVIRRRRSSTKGRSTCSVSDKTWILVGVDDLQPALEAAKRMDPPLAPTLVSSPGPLSGSNLPPCIKYEKLVRTRSRNLRAARIPSTRNTVNHFPVEPAACCPINSLNCPKFAKSDRPNRVRLWRSKFILPLASLIITRFTKPNVLEKEYAASVALS